MPSSNLYRPSRHNGCTTWSVGSQRTNFGGSWCLCHRRTYICRLPYVTPGYCLHNKNNNKAKLRDLIAVTGLVILFKFDSNEFFSPCDLEIRWMTLKTIGHIFYITSSFMHHYKSIGEFKLVLLSGNAQFGSKSTIFCPVWPWNLTDDLENNRAHLLSCFMLCASFHNHQWIQTRVTVKLYASFQFNRWIQTGVTVRKRSIRVKIGNFFVPCDLEIWRMTLKSERAHLLSCFKLCTSFHSHQWI